MVTERNFLVGAIVVCSSMRPIRAAVLALCFVLAVSACSGASPAADTSVASAAGAIDFLNSPNATATAGVASDIKLSVTDPHATLTESGTLPAGLSFKAEASGTAVLAGDAGPTTGGVHHLTITAKDSGRSAVQHLSLTVDQAPLFISGDVSTVSAWPTKHTNAVFLAAGYPAPTLSYSGQLPSGFNFQSVPGGGAIITGSPGVFQSPCSRQITLQASNSVSAATFNVVIRIDNVRCPCSPSACVTIIKNAIQNGPQIINGSKVVGQWLVQNGKKVGQLTVRNGKVISVDVDEDADELADGLQ
jgi:hypothetical protein